MARMRKIPKDTEAFHFHNENPKGQRSSDCVIRAIARATGKTWLAVYDGLSKLARQNYTVLNDPKLYPKYLEQLGWVKHKQPRKLDNTKYTGAEFAKIVGRDCVVSIGSHHLSCIVGGKVNDTWDCSDRCVGNYWTED